VIVCVCVCVCVCECFLQRLRARAHTHTHKHTRECVCMCIFTHAHTIGRQRGGRRFGLRRRVTRPCGTGGCICMFPVCVFLYHLYLCPLVCACVYELSSMSPLELSSMSPLDTLILFLSLIACIPLSAAACVTRHVTRQLLSLLLYVCMYDAV